MIGPAGHPTPAPRTRLKWIGLDHDGTMAQPLWTPANPTSEMGEPIWENLYKAMDLIRAGYGLVVHTSRADTDTEAIELWYRHYGVPIIGVRPGKMLAAAYIDDRAVPAERPDWLSAVKEINR